MNGEFVKTKLNLKRRPWVVGWKVNINGVNYGSFVYLKNEPTGSRLDRLRGAALADMREFIATKEAA